MQLNLIKAKSAFGHKLSAVNLNAVFTYIFLIVINVSFLIQRLITVIITTIIIIITVIIIIMSRNIK